MLEVNRFVVGNLPKQKLKGMVLADVRKGGCSQWVMEMSEIAIDNAFRLKETKISDEKRKILNEDVFEF